MATETASAQWRRAGPVLLLAALPWSWFAVRDLGVVADVVAIGLPVLAVLVVGVILVVSRRPRALVAAASTVLMATVAVLGPWLPHDRGTVGGQGIAVAGANVDNRRTPVPALRELAADVLVVAEVTEGVDSGLRAGYPHRWASGSEEPPRIAVFSRYPIRLLEPVGPELPGARLEVAGPDGPFVLYALHIPRPWFSSDGGYQASVSEHLEFAEQVARRVRAETLPAVVVGDLNSTDRGRDYRSLVREGVLADAMLDYWGGPTSVSKWLPLLGRIDHLMISEEWCGDGARRIALPGSSHRAVTATVGPCAAPVP